MFNIFIAETILKQVIETEGKKPEASRSYLYINEDETYEKVPYLS